MIYSMFNSTKIDGSKAHEKIAGLNSKRKCQLFSFEAFWLADQTFSANQSA